MTDARPDASELSFDAWVEVRAAALLRFAYLVTGSQHAAEDAVQSALTRACEKWSRVRRTTDPDAYVRRMVVNAHVSGWRRSGKRELSVAEVRPTRTGPDHADAVARDDAVWRVCTGLPRQQRAAVVLRYYEDLEYAEIAAILDCTETTARSHVHRALTSLRAELERQEKTDG
ncbi:SigE family RNA polymerase sigma factor [Nocardioides sp.]|uniref:SigE family RNA polymerase sigma factor n=1 Tax=Nocardioides sp. TaxID=35761 RepID=UPI0031FEF2ED